jgi:hypothetical protein
LAGFGSPPVHLDTAKLSFLAHYVKGENCMQLRSVLKLAIGMAVGATALVGVANAAPLAPASSAQIVAPRTEAAQPALVSQAEVDQLKPQQVRFGRHGHHHHWRHHHWHHRHGGWHHRHWHRHHWR